MTSSDTTLPQIDPASATVAWDQLSERVDSLIAGWESPNRPPALGSFLPAEPAELRRLILTELIKVDLEYRWQQHHLPKTIEEYLTEFPELAVGGSISPDLIYEEYHVRRQTSDPPDPREYLRRFPQQAEQLRRMLDLQGGATTTTAVGSKRRPVDIGERIDDFDVLLTLGKGAFASVYLARQRSMQRIVALKVSRDHGGEPQTLAQLDHPYIVRVYDQRVLPDNKLRLLYMQHIPGGTLQDVLQFYHNLPQMLWNGKHFLAAIDEQLEKHGESAPAESSVRRRLTTASWPEVVCWFGARLASALDHAHRRGVLHRDVKPANVLLSPDGSPKLADFNVSFSSKLDGATPAAYFGGSLAYMSPEQLEASDPDHSRQPDELDGRSDIYSLGVLLWEMLFGTRPFGEERMASSMSETLKVLAARRLAGVPQESVDALPKGLPGGLVETLLSCLAPNPADRPAAAGAVGRQLELCLQPNTQRVFRPSPKSYRELVRKYPVRMFTFAGVLPNFVFSVFNLAFNFGTIVQQLTDAQQKIFGYPSDIRQSDCVHHRHYCRRPSGVAGHSSGARCAARPAVVTRIAAGAAGTKSVGRRLCCIGWVRAVVLLRAGVSDWAGVRRDVRSGNREVLYLFFSVADRIRINLIDAGVLFNHLRINGRFSSAVGANGSTRSGRWRATDAARSATELVFSDGLCGAAHRGVGRQPDAIRC